MATTKPLTEAVRDPLAEIRSAAEADLTAALERLDAKHRAEVRDAIKEFGRVQNIPDYFWDRLKTEIATDESAVVLALIMLGGDAWTTDRYAQLGLPVRSVPTAAQYRADAAARQAFMADTTVDTLRQRLTRRIEDAIAGGPGKVGTLTDKGIDQALDDVFTKQRRETIATDQTTGALSKGQLTARERLRGGDGAATNDEGQSVTLELIWRTSGGENVCPRCSPLEGQPESVWGQVFPDGPGNEAHPRCACRLEPRLTVEAATVESLAPQVVERITERVIEREPQIIERVETVREVPGPAPPPIERITERVIEVPGPVAPSVIIDNASEKLVERLDAIQEAIATRPEPVAPPVVVDKVSPQIESTLAGLASQLERLAEQQPRLISLQQAELERMRESSAANNTINREAIQVVGDKVDSDKPPAPELIGGIASLRQSFETLSGELRRMLAKLSEPKPEPKQPPGKWRFTVNRDADGDIETIDAIKV